MKQNRRHFLVAAGAMTVATAIPFTAHAEQKLKIGVIGSGNVGSALGGVWVQAGHEVMFSSRHIDNDRALAAELGAGASAGTPREAAAFGDVLLFAVPYGALPQVGKDLADLIDGKVAIDACNPFPHRDGEIADWALEKGAGLASAELLPGARIVRAFNAVGAKRMAEVHKKPGRIGMPIAGNDAEAIEIAAELIREIGFEPVLVGNLTMGKYLMPRTVLAGERSPAKIRKIAAKLD